MREQVNQIEESTEVDENRLQKQRENQQIEAASTFAELNQLRGQVTQIEESTKLTGVNQLQKQSEKDSVHETDAVRMSFTETRDDEMEIRLGNVNSVNFNDNSLFDDSMYSIPSTSSAQKSKSQKPLLNKYHKWCKNIFKKRKLSSDTSTSSKLETGDSFNVNTNAKLDKVVHDLGIVKEGVTKLSTQVEKLKLGDIEEEVDVPKKSTELNARQTLIQTSKTIPQIARYFENLDIVESEDFLSCKICDSGVPTSAGRFHYDFSLGSNFQNKGAPREFINLKKKLVKHLESKFHIKNSEEEEIKTKEREMFRNRNFKVGMILGRQAYSILAFSRSHSRIPRTIPRTILPPTFRRSRM